MATVRYEGATKAFGSVTALRDLSLEIAQGEFMVLVGPSGSGKTTALRLLAGLEGLSDGHIWVGDRLADSLPPRDRDIAMVFQDYALYPQMSVFQNMAFGLKMRGLKRGEIREQVDRAAELLELEPVLGRRPAQLSGGQRQRVALGRALVRNPQVFLMDEPLSNLDAKLRVQTRSQIKRLQQELGTTTIYVTHDQVEAMTMGDRVAVIHDGTLQQAAKPDVIYDAPDNLFVATFIGSPPMSAAAVACEAGVAGATLRRGRLHLEFATSPELPHEVFVGVRPEHLQLWGTQPDLVGPIQGSIEFVEILGRETFIGLRVDEHASFTAVLAGRPQVALGDTATLGVVPGTAHIFDAASGRHLCRL